MTGGGNDLIAAAKLWLTSPPAEGQRDGCGDMPYLATAAYALSTVWTDQVATCAVDSRWRLYVNEQWSAGVEVPTLAVHLAHQVWHLLSDHASRAEDMQVGTREADAWHAAADACIATLLSQAGLAHDVVGPAELELPPGLSAEEYYAMLGRLSAAAEPEEVADPTGSADSGSAGEQGVEERHGDTSCGSGCDGLPRSYERPDGDDAPAVGTAEAEQIRRTVAIAYRGHVTSWGTEPDDALRWARGVLESVVPWQQVLAAAVRRCVAAVAGAADYTYARPSRRRAAAPKVVLPGMRRPLPAVAVVVDTSGSVDDGLLAQALGEVEGALRGLGVAGARLQVLACDADVHVVTTVSRSAQVRLAGGGGTDMRVGIASAIGLRPAPEVVVVLTDGYTPWPDDPVPGVAVVVGLLGRDRLLLPETPPWAMRVECVSPA